MTRWSGVPVAGAVLVVVLWGCGKDAGVPAGGAGVASSTMMSPIKCPQHGDTNLPVADPKDSLSQRQRAIARDAARFSSGALVPEVNDCQRLIVHEATADDGHYGPLGMLFAADALDSVLADLDSARQPRRAAAAIYLTDEGYAPLALRANWNCLYLVPMGNRVEGRVTYVGSAQECNRKLASMPPPWGELDVSVKRPKPGTLLSVARWTDSFRGKEGAQHIWLRCGDMTCDVHDSTSQPPVTVMPGPVRDALRRAMPDHPARERVLDVHGWYDDQILALPIPGAQGGKPRVGRDRAYIVPSPALDAMTEVSAFDDWVPVAYAYFPATIPEYGDKLNFFEGVNTILLHRGELPKGITPVRECHDPTATEMWYAKVVPEAVTPGVPRPPKYYCAPRFEHPVGMHFPGAARWRWLDDDETTWVRCPKGCCAVE